MTLNTNGLRTRALQKVTKLIQKPCALPHALHEDIAGLQGPHLYTDADVQAASSIFEKSRYHFICSPAVARRGGAPVIIHQGWTVLRSESLEPKILIAHCSNGDNHSGGSAFFGCPARETAAMETPSLKTCAFP